MVTPKFEWPERNPVYNQHLTPCSKLQTPKFVRKCGSVRIRSTTFVQRVTKPEEYLQQRTEARFRTTHQSDLP